jgi:hypothetical protein
VKIAIFAPEAGVLFLKSRSIEHETPLRLPGGVFDGMLVNLSF